MQFEGTQTLPASRALVWAQLNDMAALQACVPGCESLVAEGEHEYLATVVASVGPVKAKFKGRLNLSDHRPGLGYRMAGKGEGGIAGFGRMDAEVVLSDAPGGTLLSYSAQAQVGGKLAQIGSRLVSSAAQKIIGEFFQRFTRHVEALAAQMPPEPTPDPTALSATEAYDGPIDDDQVRVELEVNGTPRHGVVEARTLLVDFLRKTLGLTGTHVGCDTSQCGACTVNLNGHPVKSCSVLAAQASGGQVVTVEGLACKGQLHPVQEAFVQCHGLQCGFCTPGMIMAIERFLDSRPTSLDDHTIIEALDGNICRCTGYVNIIEAVRHAARAMNLATEGATP